MTANLIPRNLYIVQYCINKKKSIDSTQQHYSASPNPG